MVRLECLTYVDARDGRGNAPARREGADHLESARLTRGDEVFQQSIYHIFVEDPLVAKPLQV